MRHAWARTLQPAGDFHFYVAHPAGWTQRFGNRRFTTCTPSRLKAPPSSWASELEVCSHGAIGSAKPTIHGGLKALMRTPQWIKKLGGHAGELFVCAELSKRGIPNALLPENFSDDDVSIGNKKGP